jgi:hypothetical protein
MGAQRIEVAAGGVLVVELLAEAEEVAVVEAREVAVDAGLDVAAVLVAGEDARGKTVAGLERQVGQAEFLAGPVDHVGGAERILVEEIEIGLQLFRVDRVAGLHRDPVPDLAAGKPAVAGHGDGADARLEHHDLQHAVGDVLRGDGDIDHRMMMVAVINDDRLDHVVQPAARHRLAEIGHELGGEILRRGRRDLAEIDAVGAEAGLHDGLGRGHEDESVEVLDEHLVRIALGGGADGGNGIGIGRGIGRRLLGRDAVIILRRARRVQAEAREQKHAAEAAQTEAATKTITGHGSGRVIRYTRRAKARRAGP